MTSLADLCVQTKKEFSNIVRPLSAYQYYTKAMLEKWTDMSNDEKRVYIALATNDHTRYEREKETIREKSEEEVKKLKIFLSYTGDRVPCVGLDNGFTSYTIRGPMDTVELFTEEEKQKLIEKGVPEKYIGKYKSINGIKFNWRAARKWDVTVYGGSQNYRASWGGLRENYEGKAGQFTSYNNYKGETWTVDH